MGRFLHPSSALAWLAAFCIVCPCSRSAAEEPADLLSLVRVGHRAARESIRTLSATASLETVLPKKGTVATVKYWRSLNVVRIHEQSSNGIADTLLKDAEVRQVGQSRQPDKKTPRYIATRLPPTGVFSWCNVWPEMLIEFPGLSHGQVDFDQFPESAEQPPKVKRDTLDGRKCLKLTMRRTTTAGTKTDVTLWHDVGYNYLARKMVEVYENRDASMEAEILDFVESPPGVFLPTQCRRQVVQHGKKIYESLTVLADVRINEPILPSVFQLPAIPRGTLMRDTTYPVDENWQPIGPAEPISKAVVSASSDGKELGARA